MNEAIIKALKGKEEAKPPVKVKPKVAAYVTKRLLLKKIKNKEA